MSQEGITIKVWQLVASFAGIIITIISTYVTMNVRITTLEVDLANTKEMVKSQQTSINEIKSTIEKGNSRVIEEIYKLQLELEKSKK